MMKEPPDVAPQGAQASSSVQPTDNLPNQGDQTDPPFFGPAMAGILDDRNLIAKQKTLARNFFNSSGTEQDPS